MKTALIVGASRGIGREFARQYRRAGWRVLATARDEAALDALAGLGAQTFALDIAVPEEIAALGWKLDGEPLNAAVIVAGYNREIKDAQYNPLPRDVVVQGNRIGRNGWNPQIPGVPEAAAFLPKPMPPVLWDGATRFTRDGAPVDEPTNVVFSDGPVLKLNLPEVRNLFGAKPQVLDRVDGAPVAVFFTTGRPSLPNRMSPICFGLPMLKGWPAIS